MKEILKQGSQVSKMLASLVCRKLFSLFPSD